MKKVLALVLAVVLAFGMATVGFAANAKINGVNDQVPIGISGLTKGSVVSSTDDVGALDLTPPSGQKLQFILDTTNFTWGDGTVPTELTLSMVNSGNITAVYRKTTGYPALKNIAIKTVDKKVVVEIEFIDELVSVAGASSTSSQFEYEISLAHKRTRVTGSSVIVAGAIYNPTTYVSEGNDSAYTADGTVVDAEDYVRNLKLEAGPDVFVTMNVFSGYRYYCRATMDMSATDSDLVEKYPEIETVVTMKTATNASRTAFNSAKVEFDFSERYYVYREDGQYIGLSSETLPFSNKYYLSLTRIDMGEDPVVETPSESGSTTPENPIMGGDDVVTNNNNNPSTGANGFVNVAVVAGLVALAAAGAVSLKK